MSHNRKGIGRSFQTPASPQQQNRRFTYLVALVAALGLLAGLILTGGSADAKDGTDQLIANIHQDLDNLKQKNVYLKKELTRSDLYADCLKRENRYLTQVLNGDKNYYAGPVCKR